MKKPVIAIDGYSSTGKSSISKIISEKLGLVHFDTGALYRGVTFYALENFQENGAINFQDLVNHLKDIQLEFRDIDGTLTLFLNGRNISKEIRSHKVSENVSPVAKLPEVREYLLAAQRNAAKEGGIILDGRDIGTVVVPDADFKFFVTASVEERTRRRFLELSQCGEVTDEVSVKKNLQLRDKIDSERETAPLKKAADAILVDNTNLDKQQTIELILSYIKSI